MPRCHFCNKWIPPKWVWDHGPNILPGYFCCRKCARQTYRRAKAALVAEPSRPPLFTLQRVTLRAAPNPLSRLRDYKDLEGDLLFLPKYLCFAAYLAPSKYEEDSTSAASAGGSAGVLLGGAVGYVAGTLVGGLVDKLAEKRRKGRPLTPAEQLIEARLHALRSGQEPAPISDAREAVSSFPYTAFIARADIGEVRSVQSGKSIQLHFATASSTAVFTIEPVTAMERAALPDPRRALRSPAALWQKVEPQVSAYCGDALNEPTQSLAGR